MCSKSVGVVSNKTILKNHPFVENAEDEQKQLEDEQKKKARTRRYLIVRLLAVGEDNGNT